MVNSQNERVTLRLTSYSRKELDKLTEAYGFKNRSETMRALIEGKIFPSNTHISFVPNDILQYASREVREGYFPTTGEAVRYYMRLGYELRKKQRGETEDYKQKTLDDFVQE